jgi:hypothetical protein
MHPCHMEKGSQHSVSPIDLSLLDDNRHHHGISVTASVPHQSYAIELEKFSSTHVHLPQQAPVPIYLKHLSFRC